MPVDHLTGYLLVLAAGVFQGSFMLPMKFTRQWAWENTWLVFSCAAYFVWPWTLALLTLPHLGALYKSTSNRSLILIALFGYGWGLGALTFGLGIEMLGLALGFALIIGLAAVAGSFIPIVVFSPQKLSQPQGLLTVSALVLVLIGIILCSWAGNLRDSGRNAERAARSGSYALGLLVCIASGILSSCANLSFAFGGEVVQHAIAQGAPESMAGNSLLALITVPLFLCNASYCVRLLRKRGTARLFLRSNTRHYWLLSGLMGALWIAGFVCYTPGIRRLGSLGTSVGWSVMMTTMVLTANVWGLLTGEWKGTSPRSLQYLITGVVVLLLAICLVGYANHE